MKTKPKAGVLAFFAAVILSLSALCVSSSCLAKTPAQTPAQSPEQTPLDAVPQIRLDRLARGANVTRWFRFPLRETPEYFADYISDGEAAFMRNLGLTHVRLCVAPKFIMDPATGGVLDEHAKYLEAAIRRFHRAGLLVVVDIHNEDRNVELDPAWQEAFVTFWKSLAARLSVFDPDWTVFEVINEPVFSKRESEWPPLNARLVSAIRKSAPRHTIITSGTDWGGINGLLQMKPLRDKNIVYSFHCYDPFVFTHQGATWGTPDVRPLRGVPYPSSPDAVAPLLAALDAFPKTKAMLAGYGRDQWNKEKMRKNFKRAIDWGKAGGVPLYCGEFGVYPKNAKPEHRAAWFRDFGQVLRENRIGWAVWGWDEGFGLARKYEGKKIKVDPVVAQSLGLGLKL